MQQSPFELYNLVFKFFGCKDKTTCKSIFFKLIFLLQSFGVCTGYSHLKIYIDFYSNSPKRI